jgi:exopolyphosphatase/guanosine-5'-triphosphate,3'-diphosphate pyrophosphatase
MNISNSSATLAAVIQLAQTCDYDTSHTSQVTRLALRLFDQMQPLHNLGTEEREWLHYAGVLHDIGWIEGWKEHHKVALRIILDTPLLPFSNKERLIIGSIARYHRKALPDVKHDHYAALSEGERRVVDALAAMLRLADGLDSSHQRRVRDLACKVTAKKIVIQCAVQGAVVEEQKAAMERCDLMCRVFGRKIKFEWKDISGNIT